MAAKFKILFYCRKQYRFAIAIQRIYCKRMTDIFCMHPDLVRAAGMQSERNH